MGKLFGTDGARGVANVEITPNLAFNIGKASAEVLKSEEKRPIFVVGKDTRISGDLLESAFVAGVLSVGGNVIKLGVLPTPAVAYLVKYYNADAGVVISASHNTFEYNGIKLFNSEGFKLDDDVENAIEELIANDFKGLEVLSGEDIGRCLDADDNAHELYIKFLLSTIDIDLKKYRVVLDCANGASFGIAPKVYEALGADLVVIGNNPDGININDNCGSTKTQQLRARVLEENADVGLAYDGDADRLMVVDEKGHEVSGDVTLSICAKMLKERGELDKGIVTASVMSNIGLHKFINGIGAKVEVTNVGDRYVIESMLKTGSVIGGEQSGHMIFLKHTTTGDGILSSLQFMKALDHSGKKVSELAEQVEIYPQVLVNAQVKNENKKKYEDDKEIQSLIKNIEEKMADQGRVLIRPSGTEPIVRVMIEGKNENEISEFAYEIANKIMEKFNE